MIVKFRYDSEFSLCSENLAIAKISLSLRKFRYACEIANLLLLLPTSSSLLFLHPRLDEIDENSYELDINQHNFDTKLHMMVKVYETCKTTKNYLEKKSIVLIGPVHVNRLK